MNLTEYREKISEINAEANEEKRLAAREYAISNSSVKVGDVIEDHVGRVMVESVGVYYSDPPQCTYTGHPLTATGKPRKAGKKRTVYQQNLINANNAPG